MKRLTPDPAVGVTDLIEPLKKVCEQSGTWDLLTLLQGKHKESMTWKCSADAEWLGQEHVSGLFVGLFRIHRNGVLSSKKVRLALEKIQATVHRMNFSKKDDKTWIDVCDEQLRICAAQYRELKKNPLKYQRAIKKASLTEKEYVDRVLAMLALQEESAPDKAVPLQAEEAPGSPKEEAPGLAGLVIFDNILKKVRSDPPTPQLSKGNNASSSSVSLPMEKKEVIPADLNLDKLSANEKEELVAWMLGDVHEVKKPRAKRKKTKQKDTGVAKKPAGKPKALSAKPKAKPKTFKPGAHKTSFKHRATSTAYHKAKKSALGQGQTAEEASAAGRAASQAVAMKIEAGELLET